MSSVQELLGTTGDGHEVYLDEGSTHAATHLSDTPDLLEYVKEALPRIRATNDNIFVDVDLGRVIGQTDLVSTTEKDTITYAKRPNRDNYARFVKNRQRPDTTYVTVILHKIPEGYRLFSAWVGRVTPPFPGDSKETAESKDFWKHHALVWGRQEVQEASEVFEWPWGQ